jgi:PIN domain-containing protein
MSRSPAIIALLDANVLYPAPLRDYFLHLASLGMYEPLWTETIQEEWVRNLLAARPDIARNALEATKRSMNKAFPGASITGYESLIEGIILPDINDRHVLAAAIMGRAQVIVTANIKDFPTDTLNPYSIQTQHPDVFVSTCIDRDSQRAIKALQNQVKSLKNPVLPLEKVLDNLEKTGLTGSVAKLKVFLP